MTTTIAVVGAGAMGSAIGQRLVEQGARVLALQDGRSEASLARAKAAGMVLAPAEQVAEASLILSVVPPAAAVAVARGIAPALMASHTSGAFIDCNAVNPATMADVAAALADTGWPVLDGAIIGGPPRRGEAGPALYVSGDAAGFADVLASYGIRLKHLDGPLGAASALKMVYAGVNKGVIALGSAMLLAAERTGTAAGLRAEMAESQPALLAKFRHAVPDMLPKAERWVAEMDEIAAFLGGEDPATSFIAAAANLFRTIAADRTGEGALAARLLASVAGGGEER
ncbi:MAG: NAD(P)-dependent oxidoreductase [Acetobacteraceae bacterium]|nr:NAD(P)-dependent oxidoreductase [Acetobacteraceae bacterium]